MRWNEGSEQMAAIGNVLNISGGGAAVLVEMAPAVGSFLDLQIGRGPPLGPIEACLLARSTDPSGKTLIRLQFMHWVSINPILEKHLEKRLWERFPAKVTQGRIRWFEAGSENTVRGRLLNISAGGAAIIVDGLIPAKEPVFFELESESGQIESTESTLVATSLDPSGLKIARIKFIDLCPMRLFELAIHGSS